MGLEECATLAKEAESASKHSLDIASSIYEDAAKCYDEEGNRRKSGQFLTLAGDLLIEINKENQAATCYGKAILRYLMVEDIETAQILISKGAEYGFSSANHHYRIALDSLDRRKQAELETEAALTDRYIDEKIIEEESLPEVEIMPLEDDEPLITLKIDEIIDEEDIHIKQQDFFIPQLEKEDPSKVGSFAVLAAVSKTTRDQTRQESQQFQTNAVVKDVTGETKVLEPSTTLAPMHSEPDQSSPAIQSFQSGTSETTNFSTSMGGDPMTDSLDGAPNLSHPDTLDFEYSGKTEIVNEYAEEIHDIEVVNTIPFQWQVIDIKSDFDLDEKRRTDEGLVYTWKKDKIDPGRRMEIEYVLRKRVERSIILRKRNKVSVVSLYHSIQKDLQAQMEFVNTTGDFFEEILVEDVIPPELVVNEAISAQDIKPVALPTHDSTLYRWIFSRLPPGDTFSVKYSFREKPITRWYTEEIESNKGIVKVEKISQPFVDSRQSEYIWMYIIHNPTSDEIRIEDRIPWDYEIVVVENFNLATTRGYKERNSTHSNFRKRILFPLTTHGSLLRVR
jgi:hypothetical protein